MRTLPVLLEQWDKLHKIPVDNDYRIQRSFLHFPIGTDRFLIWAWFESQSTEFKILDHLL